MIEFELIKSNCTLLLDQNINKFLVWADLNSKFFF